MEDNLRELKLWNEFENNQYISGSEENHSNRNDLQGSPDLRIEQYEQACLTFLKQSEICERHRKNGTLSDISEFLYPTLFFKFLFHEVFGFRPKETIRNQLLPYANKNMKNLPPVEISSGLFFALIASLGKKVIQAKKTPLNAFEQEVKSVAAKLQYLGNVHYKG